MNFMISVLSFWVSGAYEVRPQQLLLLQPELAHGLLLRQHCLLQLGKLFLVADDVSHARLLALGQMSLRAERGLLVRLAASRCATLGRRLGPCGPASCPDASPSRACSSPACARHFRLAAGTLRPGETAPTLDSSLRLLARHRVSARNSTEFSERRFDTTRSRAWLLASANSATASRFMAAMFWKSCAISWFSRTWFFSDAMIRLSSRAPLSESLVEDMIIISANLSSQLMVCLQLLAQQSVRLLEGLLGLGVAVLVGVQQDGAAPELLLQLGASHGLAGSVTPTSSSADTSLAR